MPSLLTLKSMLSIHYPVAGVDVPVPPVLLLRRMSLPDRPVTLRCLLLRCLLVDLLPHIRRPLNVQDRAPGHKDGGAVGFRFTSIPTARNPPEETSSYSLRLVFTARALRCPGWGRICKR